MAWFDAPDATPAMAQVTATATAASVAVRAPILFVIYRLHSILIYRRISSGGGGGK
jgi:hypothetical protein